MAEAISENPQSIREEDPLNSENIELDSESAPNPTVPEILTSENSPNGVGKREREEEPNEGEEKDEISKKAKVETSAKVVEVEEVKEEKPLTARLGPKDFESGEEMFNYFYKFLHYWPPNLDINKYEHMVLLDLLKKGHAEPDKKIGVGIKAFQVRYHPMWKSRCFFLVRVDGTSDDFSFRKCVDHILPLPDNMKLHSSSDGNNALDGKKYGGHQKGGGGGGRGGRGGRGRGRGRRGGFGK